jgi:hypothetical protein
MSRADQIARQQRRAFSVLKDTVPGTVTIASVDYDVALVTGPASHAQDLGLRLVPESITFWLDKCDHLAEPAMRTPVSYAPESGDSVTYYLDDVFGRGDMFQHWRCRAVRHLGR